MATTLFDFEEASFNGAYSGWIVQANGSPTGSRINDPDGTVLIAGLQALKSTIANGSTVSVDGGSTFQERADVYYNGGAGPSPAGSLGISAGTTQWYRWAQKTAADYVPQNDGITPRWNNCGGEFHNTGSGPQANIQVLIDASVTKVAVDINGGVAASWPGSGTQRQYNLFNFVAGDLLDFKMQVKWATDGTGFVKIWVSINGGAYTLYVNDTGPNLWVGESAYAKMANYRRANQGGHTNTVYFTGLIKGDVEGDLQVPAQGTHEVGDTTTTGTTVSFSGVGQKRATKITMPSDGTITHLKLYVTTPGNNSGKIANLMAVYADSAGAPGAKLAQTREFVVVDGAAGASGWCTIALSKPLAVTNGEVLWLSNGQGINGSNLGYNTHVGSAQYASDADTYTATIGLSDPFGASTTGNPNRTVVASALYSLPGTVYTATLTASSAVGAKLAKTAAVTRALTQVSAIAVASRQATTLYLSVSVSVVTHPVMWFRRGLRMLPATIRNLIISPSEHA